MPGAAPLRRGRGRRPAALQVLADLIAEALAEAVTGRVPRPAVAPAAGAPLAMDALGSPAASRPSPRPRPSRNLKPLGPRAADGGSPNGHAVADGHAVPDGTGTDHTVVLDEQHVETWELVRRAQAGDGEAFGLLYDRYVDLVFRFISFRLNDRALAEDFTSETFLRALRRIGTLSYQGRDVGAWFVTIARHIVLDHLKSARNRLETTTGDTIESKEHERSTESAVLDSLQSRRLMAAVRQLGDEQRECVTLRFVHGLSVSETATVMGKNEGAIKALQHRAVRKLATLVGDELR